MCSLEQGLDYSTSEYLGSSSLSGHLLSIGVCTENFGWPGPTMMHCHVLRSVAEALFIEASNDLSID